MSQGINTYTSTTSSYDKKTCLPEMRLGMEL